LAGCAISTPLGPIFGGADDGGPTTGSITPRDKRFSNMMTDEDWTLARVALDAALGPANSGRAAPWDSPASGLKGTIAPVATAYADDDRTCQAFIASLTDHSATHWYQGRACKTGKSGWTVVDASDWIPPGQGPGSVPGS
jgi:surface antigen